MSEFKSSNPASGLRAIFARFRADQRGNIAVIFAISILPILGLIGAAVDYTRANNARSALQSALDTTSLMISKDAPSMTASQIQARAQQYFNALYTHSTDAPASILWRPTRLRAPAGPRPSRSPRTTASQLIL